MDQINPTAPKTFPNYRIWNGWFLGILWLLVGWHIIMAFQIYGFIKILYFIFNDYSSYPSVMWDLVGEIGIIVGLIGIIRVKKWGYILTLISFLLCIGIHCYYLGDEMSFGSSAETEQVTVFKQLIAFLGLWILIHTGKATTTGQNPFKKIDLPTPEANRATTSSQSTSQVSKNGPVKSFSSSTTSPQKAQSQNQSTMTHYNSGRQIPAGPAPWEKGGTQQQSSSSNRSINAGPNRTTSTSTRTISQSQNFIKSSPSHSQLNQSHSSKRTVPTTLPPWEQQSNSQVPSQNQQYKSEGKTFSAENPMGSLCECGATLIPNQKFCAKCGRKVQS